MKGGKSVKKDLRSFVRGNNASSAQTNTQGSDVTPETIQQVASKYAGKSQEELYSELRRTVAEQKANGTYSSEALARFAAMAAPMMTAEQKQKMNELLKTL